MAMHGLFALPRFGHDRPNVHPRVEKGVLQIANRTRRHRRAVHQRDHGGVAASAQHVLHPDLNGAELPAFGIGIFHQEPSMAVHDGFQLRRIAAGHHDDQLGVVLQQVNPRAEEGVYRRSAFCHRRPRQQCLVATHTGGESRRQNHSADVFGSRHDEGV